MQSNFKKVIVGALFSTALVGNIFSTTSFAKAEGTEDNVTGQAGFVLTANYTEKQLSVLTDEEIEQLTTEGGWTKTENGFEKFYPAQDNSLTVNGNEVEVNSDGTFSIEDHSKVLKLEFEGNGEVVSTEVNNSQQGDVEVDLVKTIAIQDLFKNMGDAQVIQPQTEVGTKPVIRPQTEVGEKPSVGDKVHCNRFNGKFSSYVYYNHWDPRAWKNFTLSDCDYAFIAYDCENDYTSSTSCKGLQSKYNYKNCSKHLGHKTSFHKYDN